MNLTKKFLNFFRETPNENTGQVELKAEPKESRAEQTKSALAFALIVLAIVLPIRIFIAKPFIVSGTSMYPTFNTWNYLIVDQVTYKLEDPKRGDVIVFKYPRDPSRFFIKRIIALPGETITLEGTTTIIKNTENPNGFILEEPYISPDHTKIDDMTVTLGQGEYFVMGDNRRSSADSRYWGSLSDSNIVGRALVRLFPFAQAETMPGAIEY